MAAPKFDLQSHSVHSDGALTPREVVGAAADAGVELLALSDHDTAAGVPEAAEAAAAAGIGLVTATEITSIFDGQQDVHVLGYLIDPLEPGLVKTLEHSRTSRERRAEAMADALRELGFAARRGRAGRSAPPRASRSAARTWPRRWSSRAGQPRAARGRRGCSTRPRSWSPT